MRQTDSASLTQEAPTPSRTYLIAPELAVMMRAALRTQTDAEVMAAFGIGRNSWIKIRDGKPIRFRLAMRLLDRIGADGSKIRRAD